MEIQCNNRECKIKSRNKNVELSRTVEASSTNIKKGKKGKLVNSVAVVK